MKAARSDNQTKTKTKTKPMNYNNNRRTARTYTYRIPISDRKAFRKINVLQSLNDDYHIFKINPDRHDDTFDCVRDFRFAYYQSKERYDYDRDKMVGGTIPGCHDYRYNLDWQQYPNDSSLKMKNASGGGTRITGERYVGFSDSRLSNYVKIDTVVGFTPTEIEAIFNGESVKDKINYTCNHPELSASEAQEHLRRELQIAEKIGIENAYEKLEEFIDNCDHKHVLETGSKYGDIAFCEDCGRGWEQPEFEHDKENDELTVVGSV